MAQQNLLVCKHLYAWFLFISQCYSLGTISTSLYLTILYSLYLFWFTINKYLWCYNILVLNTPPFKAQLHKEISLILLLIDIALVLLNLVLCSLMPLSPRPLSLPLKSTRLLVTLVYGTLPYETSITSPWLIKSVLDNCVYVIQAISYHLAQ